MQIDKQTRVLITGANGGLGAAIARSLRERGAGLMLSGRRADALTPIAEELGATVEVADLANRADVARLGTIARDVDVLIANAGVPATGELTSFTTDEIDRILDVNLRSGIVLARAAAEGMVSRGRGSIIFVSSIAGMVVTTASSMYCATKFALRGFSLALRAELGPRGIGVTTIFPGFIRGAGMFARTGVRLPKGMGMRTPDDVGRAAVRAVEKAPAEIIVAAFEQRVGGWFGGLIPDFVAGLQRRMGGDEATGELVKAQARWRA